MNPTVSAVSLDVAHSFSKHAVEQITLLEGLGVEGDAHCGVKVQHRSRVAKNPDQPNMRQVHLIHSELFEELRAKGFSVGAAELGENITTTGIDLLNLPVDTELAIGGTAVVRLTGLRNPCSQIEDFQPGLLTALLDRAPDGAVIRKAGVMGIVISGGLVRKGDAISVKLPAMPHRAMERI